MSEELRDLRAKITIEAESVIDAMSRARGVDKGEIVREILHDYATQQILISKLIAKRLRSEGIEGNALP